MRKCDICGRPEATIYVNHEVRFGDVDRYFCHECYDKTFPKYDEKDDGKLTIDTE